MSPNWRKIMRERERDRETDRDRERQREVYEESKRGID
jgi:hypothetical protein